MPQNIRKLNNEEKQYIKDNYKTMSVRELALHFGLTNKCMRSKIERLGLNLAELNRSKRYIWSDEDIKFLKDNYLTMTYQQIADVIGENCSKSIVCLKVKSLKLPSKHLVLSTKVKYPVNNYPYYNKGTRKIFTYRENMEKFLGRELVDGEIIHHIDCDKENDSLDNLYLCSSSKHKKLHYQLETISRDLIKLGFIIFDKDIGEYKLVLPTRTEDYENHSQGQRIESEKI